MFLPILILLFSLQKVFCDKSDIGLTPPEMIKSHGYVCETHYITTEDGYILGYHRIPSSGTDKKPAVLLTHGITGSSADFVAAGPDRGLAYLLADSGYDVWIANTRGNAFSRNHTTLDPDKDNEEFYSFTFHELGYYDLANSIDYILELNGDDSLYFIGHSQGTTAFFVLTSTRPEYNEKIKLASLMAAAAVVKNYPNVFIQLVCKFIDQVEVVLNDLKIYEMTLVGEIRKLISITCVDDNVSNILCELFYLIQFAGDGGEFEKESLPVIYTNDPSNTGLKQFIHFGQQVRDGGFRYYSYGTEKNLEVYGSEEPPDYDLSKVTAPVAIYYAKNDGLIVEEDEQTLISMLPNVVEEYLVPYEQMKHPDFLYGKDIVDLVYNRLLSVLNTY